MPSLGPQTQAVVPLGASNGSDDTTWLNSTISQNAGKVIRGQSGQTYIVTTPLIVPSNTVLDMTGCTVQLKAGSTPCNIVQNTAVTAARTVMDANITAAAATLTSATASFVGGDVGKTVWVYGAGVQGEILKTTISSVTNGTTAVLAANASTTVATGQASIGPRDSNITIRGGTYDRTSVGRGAGNDGSGQTIRFRRADFVTVTGVTLANGGATAAYGIGFGDATQFSVEDITLSSYHSDGVHITGPGRYGVIRNVRGSNTDDTVSITPNDWTGNADVYGDVAHINVENIRADQTNNTVCKVLGGSLSPLTSARHIRVRNISGYATNSDESVGGVVWIGDDSGVAATTGGFLDDIVVDNVAGSPPVTGSGANNLVYVNASNAQCITIINAHVEVPTSVTQHAVYIGGTANPGNVKVERCSVQNGSTSCCVVFMDGTAKSPTLTISKCEIINSGRSILKQNTGNNQVYRLFMSDIDHRTGYAVIEQPTTSARIDIATLSNILSGPTTFLAELAGTTTLHMTNVNGAYSNSSLNIAHAAANVTVYAANCYLNGKNVVTTAGYTLASKTFGFPVDLSEVNSKATGDMAYNTNSGLSCGVGPCVYNGTAWVNIATEATY